MEDDSRFKKFFELFNKQEFFKAHEVLEDLWRETWGADRDFYQGLIQIAATFVHAQKGRWESSEKLLQRSVERFKGYPRVYQGVDLDRIFSDTRKCLDEKKGFPQIVRK